MLKSGDKKYLKRFGENLFNLRQSKGLSLRKLSYNCNIDYSKIGKIEKGEINVTLTTIIELAKGLEVHPNKLLQIEID